MYYDIIRKSISKHSVKENGSFRLQHKRYTPNLNHTCTVLQSKRAKLLILCYFVSNSVYIQYECSVKTHSPRVTTCGASLRGRGSAVSLVRRCG